MHTSSFIVGYIEYYYLQLILHYCLRLHAAEATEQSIRRWASWRWLSARYQWLWMSNDESLVCNGAARERCRRHHTVCLSVSPPPTLYRPTWIIIGDSAMLLTLLITYFLIVLGNSAFLNAFMQCESTPHPLQVCGFLTFFNKRLRICYQFLHTCYTFLSTLDNFFSVTPNFDEVMPY